MATIEDNIEIKRAGFVFTYGIDPETGAVEMLWHDDPAARCLLATWQAIEPETAAAMDAEAQEIADLIYAAFCGRRGYSASHEAGGEYRPQ